METNFSVYITAFVVYLWRAEIQEWLIVAITEALDRHNKKQVK